MKIRTLVQATLLLVLMSSQCGLARANEPAVRLIPYLSKENRYGYSDEQRHLILPAIFDEAQPFEEGRAAVRVGEKWGYIDSTGKWIVAPRYVIARPYHQGRAAVAVRSMAGKVRGALASLILTGGAVPGEEFSKNQPGSLSWDILDLQGSKASPSSSELALSRAYTQLKQVKGYVPGNVKTPPFFTMREGTAGADRFAYFDMQGRQLTPLLYDDDPNGGVFKSGLMRVTVNGIAGFIDATGKEVIPLQFPGTGHFEGDYAPVYFEKEEGGGFYHAVIDRSGKLVFDRGEYEFVDIRNGYALVRAGARRWQVLDLRSKERVMDLSGDPSEVGFLTDFPDTEGNQITLVTGVNDQRERCVYKLAGAPVLCDFFSVAPAGEGLIGVHPFEIKGKSLWGLIAGDGREIFPPRYGHLE